ACFVSCCVYVHSHYCPLHSFPTRRSSDLSTLRFFTPCFKGSFSIITSPSSWTRIRAHLFGPRRYGRLRRRSNQIRRIHTERMSRSEEHTSELQSPDHLVCRLLLDKKNISV